MLLNVQYPVKTHKVGLVPLALTALVLAANLEAQAQEQVCPTGLSPTTPDGRFDIHDNGTVTDVETGLMWRRCTHGQVYDHGTSSCTGTITNLNWQSALQAAEASNFAGHEDWRMPNVKELASLIEFACEIPAINLTVFPNTPAGGSPDYWTATVGGWGTSVWRVLFNTGALSTGGPSTSAGRTARFVRDLTD